MRVLCRFFFARPLLSLATLVIVGAELTNWLHATTPALYHDWLPWVVRTVGIVVALGCLALTRAACQRAATQERDYVIHDLRRLHQQSRAAGAQRVDPRELPAEPRATTRSVRR